MEVSICLNFTGNTNLGPTMNAFSDTDNYSSPIGGPISVANLVPDNCPYLLTGVPDGTTIIRLVSTTSPFCCVTLIVGAFNICEVCDNLGFSNATNPSIGQLSLGYLTGSCDNNISNFYLEWYGPGTGSTQLQFTSGLGTSYITPDLQHPLTGVTSPYLYPGQYRPVIKEIEIDNVVYSNTYGAYGDCFQNSPLVVLPYTISNGSAAPEPYQHCLELLNNVTQPSTGLIELSGGTNYVPFRLEGGSQADLLRISFSGGNYLTPIVLESIVIGSFAGLTPLTTEFNMTSPNLNYKTFGDSGTFTKVLCLTGLTRSAGDVLIFEIIPQGITPTDFTFCFTQLNTFDCEMCALTKPYTDYKIVQSTISAGTGDCGATLVKFNVSGCSSNADINEDLYKYIFSGSASASVGDAYGSVEKIINLTTTGIQSCPIQSFPYLGVPTGCVRMPFSYPMTYKNTSNNGYRTFYMVTEDVVGNTWLDYFQTIYDTSQSTIFEATSAGIYNNSDPYNIAYWSVITLHLPNLKIGPNGLPLFLQTCYDPLETPQNNAKAYNPTTRTNDIGFKFAANNFYITLTSTANNTKTLYIRGFNYSEIPNDTIILNYPLPCYNRSCNGGIGLDSFNNLREIMFVNAYDTTYNTPVGGDIITVPTDQNYNFLAYNTNPWSYETIVLSPTTPLTSASTYNTISMYQYENKTFPLTGTTGSYGVRVAQTATTCPNITNYTFDENSGTTSLNNYVKYNYIYNISYIDNQDDTKYKITATQISANGQPTTAPPILVGSGTSNPSTFDVIDSDYFI
jgi:hypothetical protein